MRFWEPSAVFALLAAEAAHDHVAEVLAADPAMLVWWATPVECASAIARRERDGSPSAAEAGIARDQLDELGASWSEVLPSRQLRATPQRLLRVHTPRAADSLEPATAIIAAEHEPRSLPFVCLDERLNAAAAREGFRVPATS